MALLEVGDELRRQLVDRTGAHHQYEIEGEGYGRIAPGTRANLTVLRLTDEPYELRDARGAVLPGVGAFGQAMHNLRERGFADAIQAFVASGRAFGGICLGMQLLFESSEELGQHEGLGLLPGEVRRFKDEVLVPHIGWNQIHVKRCTPLLEGVPDASYAYFVHSYYCAPRDAAIVCGFCVSVNVQMLGGNV